MNLKKLVIIIYALTLPVLVLFQEKEKPAGTIQPAGGLRVISLSPSVTRQVSDLGAGELLTGATDSSLLPGLKAESVGSYISPNLEKIIALRPDLVIVSGEDRYIQKTPLLERFGLRVAEMGKNSDFESMCLNYKRLAALIGMDEAAGGKISSYKKRISGIKKLSSPPRIVFLVSVRPLITVSGGSHISSIIDDAGGINVFKDAKTPYPLLSLESLLLSGADALIVMHPGDDEELRSLVSRFSGKGFNAGSNIFTSGDENIPYYTPGDYTVSVEKIASIIGMIKR